jgi:uncharacterized protein YprB with RNaseH-like and TPR domain
LEIGEEVETPAGRHLRIVQAVEQIWTNGERLVSARHAILKDKCSSEEDARSLRSPDHVSESRSWRRELRSLVELFPDRALFLDLETCGLSGAALFLVGLLRRIDGQLVVELLLARNYAEEKAVLVSLWQRAAVHDVLITFNGKSFDWPMVHDRSTRYLLGKAVRSDPLQRRCEPDSNSLKPITTNGPDACMLRREDPRPELIHVDMLHHARRRWQGRLPNCKLQTLERYICGRRRDADIPGAEIPAAYQRYVATGDPLEMESILFHNALDLVTLLDLSMRLAE